MKEQLNVGLLVETRYRVQSQPHGLAATLQRAGHTVVVIDPQTGVTRLDDDATLACCDVVVARGRSWEVLCLLGLAEARGIPTLNRRAAVAAVHNKADMAVALTRAGIPTPATFFGSPESLAQACADAGTFPIVVKPVFADNRAAMRIARTPGELAMMALSEPSLAQALVRGPCEVKVCGIGDEVWTVCRPARFAPSAVQRCVPALRLRRATDDYCALARRCQQLFGLDAYSIDCIETAEGPVVIDVSEFPGYAGIDEASDRLAHLVVQRATAAQH